MLFLIGTILEIVVAILAFFLPVVYTRDWEYGKITGIGKVYNQGDKNSYSLSTMYGALTIIILILVVAVAILYLVLFLTKKTSIIPRFVLAVVYLFPIGLMIAAKISLSVEGKFIGNNLAVYGTGTSSGYTGLGWLMMILMIAAFGLVSAGLIANKVKENGPNKTTGVKEIKVKKTPSNSPKKNISEDDFKM